MRIQKVSIPILAIIFSVFAASCGHPCDGMSMEQGEACAENYLDE
jgi:hypothetical protein